MDERIFDMNSKPFGNDWQDESCFDSANTREAVASLLHGIRSRKGFITLVGDQGTGKTSLLQRVADELEGEAEVVCVFDSGLGFDELLEYLCVQLGLDTDDSRRMSMLDKLNAYLLDSLVEGGNVVVIIDDAHLIDERLLEELRLLTNLETSTEKILQIVLCGELSLETKLKRHSLRQVRQRIGMRAVLKPLAKDDVVDYIDSRLAPWEARAEDIFSGGAIRRLSGGRKPTPASVNSLAARAMEIALEKGLPLVPASSIRKAEAEQRRTLKGEGSGSTAAALRWTGYGGAAFAAAAVAVLLTNNWQGGVTNVVAPGTEPVPSYSNSVQLALVELQNQSELADSALAEVSKAKTTSETAVAEAVVSEDGLADSPQVPVLVEAVAPEQADDVAAAAILGTSCGST